MKRSLALLLVLFAAPALAAGPTSAPASAPAASTALAPPTTPPMNLPPPKGAPACGITSLPAVPGTVWTYRQVIEAGQPMSTAPMEITVKVLNVGPGKDWQGHPATEIDLEEDFGARVVKTTWTCSAAGIVVGPESFFFTMEPGGPVGMTFTVTARDQVTFPADEGIVADANWIETLKADVVRPDAAKLGAKHPDAKIEVERHVLVQAAENVTINLGDWLAEKIQFDLRGRGIVGEEKYELPVNAKHSANVWLVKGLGIVKAEDAFDKTWELAYTNVPLPRK